MIFSSLRYYGNPPFNTVVLHGGPGAPGEMAPVARELSKQHGVLEPLFSGNTINEQLRELESILKEKASNPVTLIGWSWGALLGFIFTAHYPLLVKKLILVSSASFEDKYASEIESKRLSRCNENEKLLYQDLLEQISHSEIKDKTEIFKQFGSLVSKLDSFDPLPHKDEILECQYELYKNVWKEAKELRTSRRLLELGKEIKCPVVIIHGDFDPRPIEGVTEPLRSVLKNLKITLLTKCGHHPWYEKHAKNAFYQTIENELSTLT